MSGPLLVPMHLKAMVLSNEDQARDRFRLATPDYTRLAGFQPIGPDPFADLDTLPPGIHLHWTLPRPLRHAPDASAGGEGWPWVPNRWLVVRLAGGDAAGRPVSAWIVCSDVPDGTSPFAVQGDDGTPTAMRIGSTFPMTDALTSLPASGAPVLKAVGPGSATFATFAPGVYDVFAMHDDVAGIDKGEFTYHVTGWYADPASDPLPTASWQSPDEHGRSVDQRYGFAAFLGGDDPPQRMLAHAMRSGVTWELERSYPRPTDYPQNVASGVQVAVGNTAVDALAALIRPAAPTEADLLEAFQYGLLDAFDQPGSSLVLDREIRRHWFGALPGGTSWTVVRPEPDQPTALPTPPDPPLSGPQADALAALNRAQRELDRTARLYAGIGWNLYATWFAQQYLANHGDVPVDDPQALADTLGKALQRGDGTSALDRVLALKAALAPLTAAQADLEALLDPRTQVIKPASRPQYSTPNDPVVVITGLGPATQLDPLVDPTSRLPAQLVTALTIAGQRYGASSIAPLPDPHGLLPDGVQALHAEAVLLSPALYAETLVGDGSRRDEVEAAIKGLPGPAAPAAFPPASGSWEPWEQPWVPVLLDWQITVLREPAYAEGDSTVLELQQARWTFTGTDYEWAGTIDPAQGFSPADANMTLTGRTFVTPQLNFTLADQLDTYVDTHDTRVAGLAALRDRLDAIGQAGVLSQRLSGLRALLAQRDLTPAPTPTGIVGGALDGLPYGGFPAPYPSNTYGEPVMDFAPAAGTFFVIDRLEVVDFMGRTVDLLEANGNGSDDATAFYPLAAPGLKAPTTREPGPQRRVSANATERMLQLLPRLSQPAQVSLRPLANDTTHADVDLAPGATPVCGWIVPNHLDRSVAVYAPGGAAWGELFLAREGDGWIPQWQADPETGVALDQVPNPYVQAMLAALMHRTDQGAGLSDMLLAIDETLWGIDPGGPRKDQDLSVLVGRPLAIVRAELALRLTGPTWVSQDWWNIGKGIDGGLAGMTWPVRLGDPDLRDDGLIGFFRDVHDDPRADPWDRLEVVRRPPGSTGTLLRQIGADAGYVELKFTDDTVSPDPAMQQAQRLTMLIDPRASVHAFTGLLPVTTLDVADRFLAPALRTMSYLFRAGPVLTSPDAVRIPRPAERNGRWTWFDTVLGHEVDVTPADGGARLPATPPVALEGWLKLTPNPPEDE